MYLLIENVPIENKKDTNVQFLKCICGINLCNHVINENSNILLLYSLYIYIYIYIYIHSYIYIKGFL